MTTPPNPGARHASLSVEHGPEHVLGAPFHVAVIVRILPGDADSVTWNQLPFLSPLDSYGVGLTLTSPSGAVAADVPSVRRPMSNGPTYSQSSDQAVRMLVDLSDLVPASMTPGVYAMVVEYPMPIGGGEVRSASASITLRSPSPMETVGLASVAHEVKASGGWGAWTTQRPPVGPAPTAVEATDPSRFNRILREWSLGAPHLASMDPARLDVLNGIYLPFREGLKAELLLARGDEAGFQKQAALVKASYPDLTWWMERLLGVRFSWTGFYILPTPPGHGR